MCVCTRRHCPLILEHIALFFLFFARSFIPPVMTQNSSNLSDRHKLCLNLSCQKWITVIHGERERKSVSGRSEILSLALFWLQRPRVIGLLSAIISRLVIDMMNEVNRMHMFVVVDWILTNRSTMKHMFSFNGIGQCLCHSTHISLSANLHRWNKCTMKLFINKSVDCERERE